MRRADRLCGHSPASAYAGRVKPFRRGFSRRLIDGISRAGINNGMAPSRHHLVTVAGRKTGTPHSTPVSVVTDGATQYLVAPYGEVGWVLNARSAGTVKLTRRGVAAEYSIAQVPAAQAGPVLRLYIQAEPVTRPYFNVSAGSSAEAFEGEAAAHPVFKLTPVG